MNTQQVKTKRSLSGIFFRYQNPETEKWENWCFEDLPDGKQEEILQARGEEWLRSLCKNLADTINKLSETFDITAEKHS